MVGMGIMSVHVQEGVEVEHGQRELLEGLPSQKLHFASSFSRIRHSAERQPVGALDLLIGIRARLKLHPAGEVGGEVKDESNH